MINAYIYIQWFYIKLLKLLDYYKILFIYILILIFTDYQLQYHSYVYTYLHKFTNIHENIFYIYMYNTFTQYMKMHTLIL